MRIYLAGTSVANPKQEKKLQKLFIKGHKLHSYFHSLNGFETKWFNMNLKNKVDLFLDSGAFSAWTQKVKIDIEDYIHFIKENENNFTVYANLDVIGIGGSMPNQITAKRTLRNQKIMESAGLNPIPVFHFGEPFSYLEYYVKNYDYIALGVAGNTGTALIPWLDTCFSKYICGKDGIPQTKVHGFAVTGFNLMFRYPWYSVDSTSWVVTGRLGSLFIPVFRGGKFIYTDAPHKISVSSVSPNLKEAGQHISNLSVLQKKIFMNYLKEKGFTLGKSSFKKEPQTYELKDNEKWSGKKPKSKKENRTVEIIEEVGLCNTYQLRDELNAMYYIDLEKHMPEYPWAFKSNKAKGLF